MLIVAFWLFTQAPHPHLAPSQTSPKKTCTFWPKHPSQYGLHARVKCCLGVGSKVNSSPALFPLALLSLYWEQSASFYRHHCTLYTGDVSWRVKNSIMEEKTIGEKGRILGLSRDFRHGRMRLDQKKKKINEYSVLWWSIKPLKSICLPEKERTEITKGQ